MIVLKRIALGTGLLLGFMLILAIIVIYVPYVLALMTGAAFAMLCYGIGSILLDD